VSGSEFADGEVVFEREEGVLEVVREVVAEELLEEERVQLGESVDAACLTTQSATLATPTHILLLHYYY
jgi:hypothetical protein